MKFKKLSTDEMMTYAQSVLYPVAGEHAPDEIDMRQFVFCLNCPDPVGALYLLFDAPQGVATENVVEQALSMAKKEVAAWSFDSLALDHPLRKFASPE